MATVITSLRSVFLEVRHIKHLWLTGEYGFTSCDSHYWLIQRVLLAQIYSLHTDNSKMKMRLSQCDITCGFFRHLEGWWAPQLGFIVNTFFMSIPTSAEKALKEDLEDILFVTFLSLISESYLQDCHFFWTWSRGCLGMFKITATLVQEPSCTPASFTASPGGPQLSARPPPLRNMKYIEPSVHFIRVIDLEYL